MWKLFCKIVFIKGMWWYPASRLSIENYLAPFSFEKMSSILGLGHTYFHITLFKALQLNARHFPPSPLGHYNDRCWPTGVDAVITHALRSLFILLLTHSQCFTAMGHGLCETGSESPGSICILVRWVIPILISSCANCYLNVSSSWLSYFLTSFGRVYKGGVKESGLIFSSTIFFMLRLFIAVCGIWSMDGSIWSMHCSLLNMTC